ncbi:MAG TPA: DinB family protein [Anaerolineales bacterium]|nr:DinB family protein [Anaerolineales bacterium]
MVESRNMIVSGMRSSLEELWSALDSLFEEMSPPDWQRPHGPDWIFADLPYHLSYIDRYCVARPIELGEALPAAEQVQLRTLNELNAWNQGKFAARPEGQNVEISLEQMYESREYVRKVTAGLTDADLANPAWFPLLNMRGFRSAQVALAFCAGHVWQHMEEDRVRHGHAGTLVGPELTHAMLNGAIPGIPLYLIVPTTTLFLDAGRAKDLDFSFALNITGPGGGLWDFHASDTGWQVGEVESADTDLVLSMDLDAYIKMRHFIGSSEITASDDRALAVYDKLFVLPDFDFVFPQMPRSVD